MSSGKYSALSGALSRMQQMNTLSDNLANSMTVGFKKGHMAFEARLAEARNLSSNGALSLTRGREGLIDHAQGQVVRTGVATHMAIQGEGFFKVRDGADTVGYTRQGNFQLDGEGFLVNSVGMRVLGEGGGPIQLGNAEPLIDESGNISVDGAVVGRIPLYRFDNTAVMQRRGNGLFAVTEENVAAHERPVENPRLVQGSIENSNVNTLQEMSKMIEAMRAFEACQKMLKNYSSLAENAIQIGRLT